MSDRINPALGETSPIQLFRLILTLATHLRTRMDQRLAGIGITTRQAAVLTYLESQERPATLGAVAAALGTTHQNARQIVDALDRKGLVDVTTDPSDRRARRIRPTEAVTDLFADRSPADHVVVGEWLSVLSEEEQAHIVSALARLLSSLQAEGQQHSMAPESPIGATPPAP